MTAKSSHLASTVRVGEAAEALAVSVATLRRWEAAGRLRTRRTAGGQRRVPISEVQRLRRARRPRHRPVIAQSARNRFEGIVTRVERDKLSAIVEIQAGPHRIVSLVTREAVDELGLKVGDEALAVVKATNVTIDLPMGSGKKGAGAA